MPSLFLYARSIAHRLTLSGGILTVADDFLKNDGRKFLDLMEQLAERKIRQLDDELDRNGDANGEWDEGDYDDEDYDEEEEEVHLILEASTMRYAIVNNIAPRIQ